MSDNELDPTTGEMIRGISQGDAGEEHGDQPGKVVSYDAAKQRAVIQPLLKLWVGGKLVSPAALHNVPVQFPSCSSGAITWPLVKGDLGELTCQEPDIRKWLADGQENEQPQLPERFGIGNMTFKPFPARPLTALLGADKVAADGLVLAFQKIYLVSSQVTDMVAMNSKTKAEIQQLINWCKLHNHTHPQGPTTGLLTPPGDPADAGDVGSEKIFGE